MNAHVTKALSIHLPVIIILLAVSFTLARSLSENAALLRAIQDFGYLTGVLLGIIGGLNIAVPVPAITFLPLFVEAGLSKPLVIISISIGATGGDIIGYYIGRTARVFMEKSGRSTAIRFFSRFRKNTFTIPLVVFLYAALSPIPNEIIIIPLALLGYPILSLLAPLILGNVVFNALAGTGIINLFELIP